MSRGEEITKDSLKKETKEATEEEQLVIDNFKSPNLMFKFEEELSIKHKGNNKEKLLTFIDGCNCQLPPDDRCSIAIRGGTSEGKTDTVKNAIEHLPDDWYAFGTRFTRATLEDDVKDFPLIIILEKPQDEYVIQTVKQLAEDGEKIWKKEPNSGKLKEGEYIPKKTVIYTSTETETDEELSTRFLIVNIKSDVERYKTVIEHTSKKESELDLAVELESKYDKYSWIKTGLKQLKPFDKIQIPYAQLIPFNTNEARLQRDQKRFYSILKTITWLNQHNRMQLEYKDRKVLLATPEDYWWADYLTNTAFIHSISDTSANIETTFNMIKKLENNKENHESFAPYGGQPCVYIDRKKVMDALNIQSVNTIKKYIDSLEHKGRVETYQPHSYSRCYVRTIAKSGTHPLIGVSLGCQYEKLKKIENILLDTYLTAYLDHFDSILDNPLVVTNTKSIEENNNNNNNNNDRGCHLNPSKYVHLVYKDLIKALKPIFWEKLTPYYDTPPPSKENQDKIDTSKKSQRVSMNEVKKYVDRKKGNGGISLTALNDNFNPTDIQHLIESGQLIRIRSTDSYEWYGGNLD